MEPLRVVIIYHLQTKHKNIGPSSWQYRPSAAWAMNYSHFTLTMRANTQNLGRKNSLPQLNIRVSVTEIASLKCKLFFLGHKWVSWFQTFPAESVETGEENCHNLLFGCLLFANNKVCRMPCFVLKERCGSNHVFYVHLT